MAETVAAGTQAQMEASQFRQVFLIDLHFVGYATDAHSRFTSWNAAVTYDGDSYTPRNFEVSEISDSLGNGSQGKPVRISMDNVDLAFSQLFTTVSYRHAFVSLYVGALNSSGALVADPILMVVGEVKTPRLTDAGTAELSIQPDVAMYALQLKRGHFVKDCEWTFADSLTCGVGATYGTTTTGGASSFGTDLTDANDYWNGATITILEGPLRGYARTVSDFANTGGVITVSEAFHNGSVNGVKFGITFGPATDTGTTSNTDDTDLQTDLTDADDYWQYGYVVITSGVMAGVSRPIIGYTNANGTITVGNAFPAAVASGSTFTVFRGCDKRYSTCRDKYSNTDFFGGLNVPGAEG